MKYLYPQKFRF